MAISENSRRIARNTLMLYVRMFLNMGISIYTSRVVLNVLGVDNFGVYNLVGGVIVMFSFLNAGMAETSGRYMAYGLGSSSRQELRETFSTAMLVHWMLALAIIILGETIGFWVVAEKLNIPPRSYDAALWIYQFSIISALFDVTQVPYMATITAHEKMGIYAYFAILNNVLRLLIVWMLLILPGDKLVIYGALGLGVSILMCLLYRVYCARKFPECRFRWIWRPALVRKMAAFSGWTLFGNCAALSLGTLTPMLVNLFYGVVINAAIGIANAVNGAVGIFSANFINAMRPQIIKSYAAGNHAYSSRLIISGSRMAAMLVLFIGIPFVLETHFVLKVWLLIVPEYAVWLVRLMLAFLFINMLSYISSIGVHATGAVRLPNLFSGATGLLVLPVSWFFLKYYHAVPYLPYILFLGTCAARTLVNIRTVTLHMPELTIFGYLRQVWFPALAVGAVCLFLPWIATTHLSEGWGRLLMCAAISCTGVSVIAWTMVFSPLEKEMLLSILRPILTRFHLTRP